MIVLEGQVIGMKSGTYDNKPYHVAQLIGDGEGTAKEFYEASLPDGVDLADYAVGKRLRIAIAVRVNKFNKAVYRVIRLLSADNKRPGEAARPAA